MHRSLTISLIVILLLAACSPAATPAPTQAPAQPAAPAQPTLASAPTSAAPAAMPPTLASTKPPAELRPPVSGGVLNPPTLAPTTIGSRPNANTNGWITYRDQVYGVAFQYPPDWTFSTKTAPPTGVLQRLSVARLNQSRGNNAEILIDVRRSTGILLTWLKNELPRNSLAIEAPALEVGVNQLAYNAKLNGQSAVWLFAPMHSGKAEVAALYSADQAYFYSFTYAGDALENKDNRAVYLQLLTTAILSGTTPSNLSLPTTAFTAAR